MQRQFLSRWIIAVSHLLTRLSHLNWVYLDGWFFNAFFLLCYLKIAAEKPFRKKNVLCAWPNMSSSHVLRTKAVRWNKIKISDSCFQLLLSKHLMTIRMQARVWLEHLVCLCASVRVCARVSVRECVLARVSDPLHSSSTLNMSAVVSVCGTDCGL